MSKNDPDKMYVLVDEESGGVYAVWDESCQERIVQLFVANDDAVRYHGLLEAMDFPRQLEISEVDRHDVIENCKAHGYRYTLISENDIVIPPSTLTE